MSDKNNIHLPEGADILKKRSKPSPNPSDKRPHFPGEPNIPKEPKR